MQRTLLLLLASTCKSFVTQFNLRTKVSPDAKVIASVAADNSLAPASKDICTGSALAVVPSSLRLVCCINNHFTLSLAPSIVGCVPAASVPAPASPCPCKYASPFFIKSVAPVVTSVILKYHLSPALVATGV